MSDSDEYVAPLTSSADDSSSAEEEDDRSIQESESEANAEIERPPAPAESNLPRKRRRDTANLSLRPRIKRLRGQYNDGYREYYNQAVTDISNRFEDDDDENLPITESSRIGLSEWSVEEKNVFFYSLGKLGRDDLPGLAAAVKTKSMQEIREFILLLKAANVEANLNSVPGGLTTLAEIPAAIEVSETCRKALDTAAEALACYQERWDAKMERKKHRNDVIWLLNFNTIETYEQIQNSTSDSDSSDSDESRKDGHSNASNLSDMFKDPHKASSLLKIYNWIDLSTRIFMNSGLPDESEHWQNIADPEELPGIYRTAFEDFHNLTLSITSRLVQVCLMQATSRLRATDMTSKSSHSRKMFVRKGDVIAALKILGMNLNSREYWKKVARRCRLRVFAGAAAPAMNAKETAPELPYDEVEQLLGQDWKGSDRSSPSSKPTGSPFGKDDSSSDSLDSLEAQNSLHRKSLAQTLKETETTSDSAEDGESSMHSATEVSEQDNTDEEDWEFRHHEFASLVDHRADISEERRLWAMLQLEPPHNLTTPEAQLPPAPNPVRKSAAELRDWRDWIDYESPWESNILNRTLSSHEIDRSSRKRSNDRLVATSAALNLPIRLDSQYMDQ